MKQQPTEGLAAAELLYGSGQEQISDSNLANPPDTINIFGPPSIIKGSELDDPKEIAKAAYKHGYSDSMRMNRAGHLVEDDPVLDLFRKRVEEIRKEKIKRGEIEPANDEERRWV